MKQEALINNRVLESISHDLHQAGLKANLFSVRSLIRDILHGKPDKDLRSEGYWPIWIDIAKNRISMAKRSGHAYLTGESMKQEAVALANPEAYKSSESSLTQIQAKLEERGETDLAQIIEEVTAKGPRRGGRGIRGSNMTRRGRRTATKLLDLTQIIPKSDNASLEKAAKAGGWKNWADALKEAGGGISFKYVALDLGATPKDAPQFVGKYPVLHVVSGRWFEEPLPVYKSGKHFFVELNKVT